MIRRTIYLATVTSFALVSAAYAQQPALAPPPPSSTVSPVEALTIARSEGLVPLSRPVLRGRTYALNAVDPYGREVRVLLDAQVGEVVAVRPLAATAPSRAASHPDDARRLAARRLPPVLPPDFDDNPPRPPRTVPAARLPGSVQAAAMPRTPPLPRSRPAAAQPAAMNPPATAAGKPAANAPAKSTDTPAQGFE